MMLLKVPRFRRLFLHYFDIHFLELKGISKESGAIKKQIKTECRLATRFAILAADEVLIPAASYFESEMCCEIIDELRDLYHLGIIRLVARGSSLEEFIEEKLSQYLPGSMQYKRYNALKKDPRLHPPFFSRTQSASRDIIKGWSDHLYAGAAGKIVSGSNIKLPKDFESTWERVPELLDGRAFIVEHVGPLLFKPPCPLTLRNRLYNILNEHYFDSYTRELCAGVVCDMLYLASPNVVPSYDNVLPYNQILMATRNNNLVKKIEKARPLKLLKHKDDLDWQTCLAIACDNYSKKQSAYTRQMNQTNINRLSKATIGIITALPEEFAAVCDVLECEGPFDIPGTGAGRKYAIGRTRTQAGAEHVVAVGMLTGMGNNLAAIRTTLMLNHCKNLTHIIMTGIAGAVPNPLKPDDHVRLGDIVVSDIKGVVQYDLDKESPAEIEHRHSPHPPSSTLLDAVGWLTVQELRTIRPWEKYIDQSISRLGDDWQRPNEDADLLQDCTSDEPTSHPEDPLRVKGLPRVFHGPIASANKLLKNPDKRNSLRNKFSVKAVEMEGSGIADSTWSLEKGYLVVRGTCDYCNPDKGDAWHKYAALIAAAYTRAVVEQVPPTL